MADYVDTSSLPRRNENRINWEGAVGMTVPFQYKFIRRI